MRRARLIRDMIGASVITATLVFAYTVPAEAQRVLCTDRAEIIDTLGELFDETQRAFGLRSDGRVLELYASPDGSWTALVTMPSGKSCVIAAGEGFVIVPPTPVGDPA